jgi:integrase
LSHRDDLVGSWSLATGAREDEILALDLGQIPNPQDRRYANQKIIQIPIFKTKGLKPRTLYVPRSIVDRTYRYILGERAAVCRRLKKRGKTADADAVFLSDLGNRLAARTLQEHFRDTADAEGSTARFHDLRHTFAIHRLVQLRKAPIVNDYGIVIEPIKTLKEILGHAHISTVMIYLEALDVDPRVAEDAMQAWVEEWSSR